MVANHVGGKVLEMEPNIPNDHLAEYRVDSTDLLCPSQCCTSGFEEVPIFIFQTNIPRDSTVVINSSSLSSEQPMEQSNSKSPVPSVSNQAAHWIPIQVSSNGDRLKYQPGKHTSIDKAQKIIYPEPPKKQCACNGWKNWRNMFIIVLSVCFVMFIVSDLYHLTHLEVATFGAQLPAIAYSNVTPYDLLNPFILHQSNYYVSKPWSTDRFRSRRNFRYQQRLFNRELIVERMPEDLLLCSRRWKAEWSTDRMNLDQLDMTNNAFHVSAGHVQGHHVFKESVKQVKRIREKKYVKRKGENLTFELRYSSGITVHVAITGIRLLPEYHDVNHPHSDNGIVLDTSRRSNMHHWRAPIQALLKSKCRYPLPKHYYLTMHPYLDRHTTAKRRICRRNDELGRQVRSCPTGLPSGSMYYERSINGQCTQNKASFLPPQKNSFYCTTNSALVTDLFDEYITERQSYLKDAHCDTQRRLCQTCLRRSCWTDTQLRTGRNELIEDLTQSWDWMRDEVLDSMNRQNHKCCGVSCYSNPSCQEYYNPACQRYTINQPEMDEVCLQGQTLKFTLNPEFDLNNGSYLCHVQQNAPDRLYSIRTWLVIDNRWQTEPMNLIATNTEQVKTPATQNHASQFWSDSLSHVQRRVRDQAEQRLARQRHGQIWLWNNVVLIEHQSKLPIWNEAIVKREDGQDYLSIYRLKTFDQFGHTKPELQKHRDEKYVVMQVTRPFLFNTESWGNQSCHLNVSHLHRSQPIYAESTGLKITLAEPIRVSENDGAFEYIVDNKHSPSSHIELSTHPDPQNSVLRSSFCSHELRLGPTKISVNQSIKLMSVGTIVQKFARTPQVQTEQTHQTFNAITCTEEQLWRITVSGWVTSKPAYVEFEIYRHPAASTTSKKSGNQFSSRQVLRKEHLLLLPSESDYASRPRNANSHDPADVPFSLSVDLRLTTLPAAIAQITTPIVYVQLSSCSQTYTLHAILFTDERSRTTNQSSFQSSSLHTKRKFTAAKFTMKSLYLPFIVICTVIGLLYLVLLIIYGIVRAYTSSTSSKDDLSSCFNQRAQLQSNNINNSQTSTEYKSRHNRRRSVSTSVSSASNLLSMPHRVSLTTTQISTTRKVLIMIYLCFRVFYTFLFTISVAVSFVLSIESSAAREFTAALQSAGAHTIKHTEHLYGSGGNGFGPNAYVISPLDLENRWRGAKSWMFEAARLEDFAQSELLRQFQSLTGQIEKCGEVNRLTSAQLAQQIHFAGEQYKEWLDPRRERVTFSSWSSRGPGRDQSLAYNQTWSTNPKDIYYRTIDRTTWSLMENANWLPYLDAVDEYLRKVRDSLDSRVIDRWAPFDRLLANLLTNTWIAPARRALNSSWLRVKNVGSSNTIDLPGLTDTDNYYYYEDRSDEVNEYSNQNRGRSKESRALKLSNFLGVPQPAHARLTGARIWNSFRSLVPGLPARFYYDMSSQLLDRPLHTPVLSGLSQTRHLDQRYMLSNEDWKHVAGGYLGDNPNQAYRYLQNLDLHGVRTDAAPAAATTLPTYSYFLNLTQVRLILLLLDAVIILARCYQTFQFMQNVWFGSVVRVHVERVQISSREGVQRGEAAPSAFSEQFSGAYLEYADFLHPTTCSNCPEAEKAGTVSVPNADRSAETFSPVTSSTAAHSTDIQHMKLYEQKPESTRLFLRPTEFRSPVDGSTGRLTACYCCLDAHYLLIIVGIGLLLVGFVLLWATDRHVRPGWLLTKTGVYARSRALEDCRLRTNAILKTIQPNHLNRNVMRAVRRSMQSETRRLRQFHMRFAHEKVQIARQYFSELCTLEKSVTDSNQASTPQASQNLWKLSSPSACALFNSKMEFSRLVTQDLISPRATLYNSRAVSGDHTTASTEFPVCMLTPVVPATYAEGHASRMLRLAQSISKLKQRMNQSRSIGALAPMVLTPNVTNSITVSSEDHLIDMDQLSVSMGSLSALANAIHRLLLTSLTIVLAMGGMLACLHLVKLVVRQTYPVRIRKIHWITPYPPHTLSNSESTQSG